MNIIFQFLFLKKIDNNLKFLIINYSMEKNVFLENIFIDFSKNYKNTQILKPVIIFTMGIPGSGKSTVIDSFICNILSLVLYDLNYLGEERYLNQNNFVYCNPDKIMTYIEDFEIDKKEEFLGRGTIYNNKLVKKLISEEQYYENQYNIVYDATGTQFGHYLKHIELANKYGYLTILLNINCKIETAFERTKLRDRKIDLEVVEKVYNSIYQKKKAKSKYPFLNNFDILSNKVDLYFEIDNNEEPIIKDLKLLDEQIYKGMEFQYL